jgi:hypothetical protein
LFLIQLRSFGLYDCPVAETIRQRVGIERCKGSLQTLFALTLMDLAEFEWRRPDGHGMGSGSVARLGADPAGTTGIGTAPSPICDLSPPGKR